MSESNNQVSCVRRAGGGWRVVREEYIFLSIFNQMAKKSSNRATLDSILLVLVLDYFCICCSAISLIFS